MKNDMDMLVKVGYIFLGISITLIILGQFIPSLISTDKLPIWVIIPAIFGLAFLWYVMIFYLCKCISIKKEINKIKDELKRHNSN